MKTNEFIKALFGYYNQDLSTDSSKVRVKMLSKWIEENIPEEVRGKLLEKIILEFKPTGINPMPLIPHIKDFLVDRSSFEANAKEAASRIFSAIVKYGHYRQKEAKEYMGLLAWEVVNLNGGWFSICEGATINNETTSKAQWRELAKSILERKASGQNSPPCLETGLQGDVKALVDDLGNKLSLGGQDVPKS